MRLEILDVPIDNLPKIEVLDQIKIFLNSTHQNLITTPNPEMLSDSEKDWFFKEIFRQSSLNIADGFGLVLASLFLYGKKLFRYPGVDLMLDICELAAKEGKSIFLLGGGGGVAELVTKRLYKDHPSLKIAGFSEGLTISVNNNGENNRVPHNEFLTGLHFDQEKNRQIIEQINRVEPDILFVAFGHIKQEKWLISHLSALKSVKIAMGVGGAFDYISGTSKRAPKVLRVIGLEWFWRWFCNPKYRTQRVFKALFTFAGLIWEYKKMLKRPLRRGVIGYIVNKEGQFFIAKRTPEKYDCYSLYTEQWQPPQGGAEPGESLEETAIRETEEETGMKTEVLCGAKEPHCYEWVTEAVRRLRFDTYRGAEKYIFLLQYNGNGNDIKLDLHELCDFQWVSLEELKRLLHPMRRKSLEILLKECACKLPLKAK